MKFNFIDVGSGGVLSKIWKEEFINHILTFDPLDIDESRTITRYSGTRFHYPVAVSDISGERDFYFCRKDKLSSLYETDLDIVKKTCYRKAFRLWEVIKEGKINCKRLDEIIKEIGVKFDFLKVDAQGADLDVLKSAGDYISDFKGIQIECSIVPLYKKAPLIDDIDSFLKSKNFVFVKKLIYNKAKSQAWVDCLYINKNIIEEEIQFIENIYGIKINE